MNKQISIKTAYAMLFLTSIGWALSTIIIKIVNSSLPALHLMFSRFALAFVIFFILKGRKTKITKKTFLHGSYLGFFLFLAYYLSIISLTYTTASKSGFLVALSVLWVPIAQLVIHRKKPNKWVILCVSMSILGLYWISGLDGVGFNRGDAFAIGCSVAYTAYIMLIDKYGKEMNEDQMTLVILLSVALISFFFAVIVEGLSFKLIIDNIIAIILICLFGTIAATYFQTKAQQVASPESVGIILLGEPLFTLILALIILGERVTALGLLGSALLLSSLFIAVIKKI